MARLILDDQQKKLLASHGVSFDYDNITDDELDALYEKTGDLLVYEGLDDDYSENEKGHQYRDILYRILDTEEPEKVQSS